MEKRIKMEKRKLDFSNPDFIESMMREDFDEINKMREDWRE